MNCIKPEEVYEYQISGTHEKVKQVCYTKQFPFRVTSLSLPQSSQ